MAPSSLHIDVHPDYETLSHAAAEQVSAGIRTVLADQDEAAVALAGGSTPRRLYELLGEANVPWDRVHLFWGDERFVPHDHPRSNVRMVRETLLAEAEVPSSHVHSMPTDGAPGNAAARYEETLRHHLGNREHTFDLVLLGLGDDGHTASLFPEALPFPDDNAWVRAVTAPDRHDIARRLTCTLRAFNQARRAYFLVSGESKQDAVRRVLDAEDSTLPATHIRPREHLVWLLDTAARPDAS